MADDAPDVESVGKLQSDLLLGVAWVQPNPFVSLSGKLLEHSKLPVSENVTVSVLRHEELTQLCGVDLAITIGQIRQPLNVGIVKSPPIEPLVWSFLTR